MHDVPTKEPNTVKNTSSDGPDDDLRPHYDFDFKGMAPNRFAGIDLKLKGRLPILLDEDVAEVFRSPEEVNTVLRAVIKAMRTAMTKMIAKSASKTTSSQRVARKRRASGRSRHAAEL